MSAGSDLSSEDLSEPNLDGGVDASICTAGAAISCASNMGTVCNSTGTATTTAACVTLKAGGNVSMCADATQCLQCVGTTVCSADTTTSYTCSNGTLGMATPCEMGCDPSSGVCRDMVPASQASMNLKAGDTFTCTGAQDAALAAITASTGDVLTFDTTNKTIKLVNGPTTTNYSPMSKWGAAYIPTNGGTTAVVAHVKSLTATNGARIVITGSSALILLVDGDVNLSGAMGSITHVALHGTLSMGASTATAGPGAPTTTTNAAGAAPGAFGGAGGGGAGHGTKGADGGAGIKGGTGGASGAAYGTSVLEAGAGGGGGTPVNSVGGGALQISACGTIGVDQYVVINASGGGGAPGGGNVIGSLNSQIGGVGGGSGGTIVLEASAFTGNAIAGKLAANGGGGGGGGDASNRGTQGKEWDPTTDVTTAPQGGTAGTVNAGTGGTGGAATAPSAGGSSANTNLGDGGGGGGGAVGRIFLNRAPSSTAPTASAASPAPVVSCVSTTGSTVTCP